MTKTYYLIVPSVGIPRVVSMKPENADTHYKSRAKLKQDEIAFKLNIEFPDGYGKTNPGLDLVMPPPPKINQ
jgi:hypothetical protein